jgi:hypothetical protein
MADLFCVDRTACNKALEGFSQDGVEHLIHIEVEDAVGEGKGDAVLESLNWVGLFAGSFLYEIGC